MGSGHDALTSCEDNEQGEIFTALKQSAGAENPHSIQTNFACVLRFTAKVWWHPGYLLRRWGRPPYLNGSVKNLPTSNGKSEFDSRLYDGADESW